ncbi:ATP-binding cassette domain-containing protein [Neisseria sp. Ec49-e6-T10]|uniref:ATP-binding cassette domain-containing protein n=1 Tax=Neisseria sp. Ec49-e6-T10 TaxID=3140744 RepID=UPI003EC0D5DC
MAIITVENACLAFGHTALLDHVQFTLNPNEIVGLIGRNGAGKSSFLKTLSGTIKLDDGLISMEKGLKVAYVPQEPVFEAEQTVFDAVAEGLGELRSLLTRYHDLSRIIAQSATSTEAQLEQLNLLQTQLEAENGWQFDAFIHQTMGQLSLSEDQKIQELSGGQKKRVALARALVAKPDVLLLDEPTNHLDIEAIIWLEGLIKNFTGSVVLITHDRKFLDNIATRIVELDRGILRNYPGSFHAYQDKKEQELAVETEQNRVFDKFHAQEEVWIRKGIEARRTRNMGRVRRLQELRQERKQRRDVQGQVSLQLDTGEKSGKLVAELEHVFFSYEEQPIIQDFSCRILRGDKVGLIGPNGVGKTTLLKIILGELSPTKGKVRQGSKQEIAYFDQFRSQLNEEDSIFYTLGQGNDFVEVGGKKKHVMSYLSDFLFSPERANSPVSSLSGGERNRLLLAKLFTRYANILVLDEPTNDLDIDTLELLEECLREYTGTVFLVSHDRTFLDNVITQSIVFEQNGVLKEYIGGYQDYLDAKTRESVLKKPEKTATVQENNQKNSREKSQKSAKLSFNEQRELHALPEQIQALETEQSQLTEQLLDPNVFKHNHQEAALWQQRIEQIEIELLEKLERWDILETKQKG